MDVETGRMLKPENLEQYLRAEAELVLPLSAMPQTRMLIEPRNQTLTLRSPKSGPLPDVGAYDRLSIDVVEEPGEDEDWYDLRVDVDGTGYEGYSFIMKVVDQLEAGRSLKGAIGEALVTFKELLSKKRRLSDEQEIGLFGELGMFAHLVEGIGEEAATAAWLGPDSEEHDFVLPGFDAEVKTTRTEARVHVIGSATQLEPSPGRPLYLVSIQVTSAGAAAEGETLTERVRRVRGLLERSLRVFDDRLRGLGWDVRTADDLYTRRYLSRSEPRAYTVDADFPAIGSEDIASIVARPELVVGLVYRIDVTGLEAAEPPAELTGFCERKADHGE
ncbi:PD-(D/E)XK motif protein [Pseudoclavibacter sp. 13-3]|uniref:PD-(D/E)XK motif protein n=1 Tax=Pseudoclavibacter sp. 13-3 TaxID=2901228 RepID=UPI001E2DE84E|nr:PD-(D/E)XK motif protein [Pseudoclavibacter sp. 13-3]MCD7100724.1 PD-(D/E)XK motif protein [Pseudoclavibacter sp. 13-3]